MTGLAPALVLIGAGILLAAFFTPWGWLLFVLSFFSIMHFGAQRHFTPFGWDQYMKWKAFKRFINDFSSIKDASIPSIVIWEHFLVFGMTLGISQKVIQAFPRQLYQDSDFNSSLRYGALTHALVVHEGGMESLARNLQTFNQSMDATFKAASSSYSSANGSGGGSSGGSSGGGGGGSGGGAF